MSKLIPEWEFTTANEEGDLLNPSLNDEDLSVLPDPGVLETNPWLNASCSFSAEAENFQDIFGVLPDFQLHETLPVQATSNAVDEGKSSGRKRKADGGQSKGIGVVSEDTKIKQDERPKRTRSSETHNMSERRRRDRIKGKIRALQELIPNSHKSDRASMLDEAVEYLKALKLHVQMMSTGGGALCQVPYMSPAGIQSTQIPHFSQSMDMLSRPGFGMGMVSTAYSTGPPMILTPLPFLHLLPSAAAGFYLISGSRVLPVSQLQVPLMASQALPTNTATSTMPPQFTRELVTPFNYSNQGESSSQSTLTNFQQVM